MDNQKIVAIHAAVLHAGRRNHLKPERTESLAWAALDRWRAGMSAGMTIAIVNKEAEAFR